MKKVNPQDLLIILDSVRSRARRHGSDADVERVEATIAKVRAAEQDDATWEALRDETHKRIDEVIEMAKRTLRQAEIALLAETIDREIAALADELRRRGVRNPIAQAREEVAKRRGHISGTALKRWLCRKRDRGPGGQQMSRDKLRLMP